MSDIRDTPEYRQAHRHWAETLGRHADPEVLHAKAVRHVEWQRQNSVAPVASEPIPVAEVPPIPVAGDRWLNPWRVAMLVLLVFLCLKPAHCQFSKINSVQLKNNDNSSAAFFTYPFAFKVGPNCSWSIAGTVATINCSAVSGGAGGSNGQVQWNSTGSLAGISTLTTDGTANTAKVGTNWNFVDPTDTSKKLQLDLSSLTTATTRTLKLPDANSYAIKAGSTTGQIPIWNASTSTFDVSDPLVQGTQAAGSTTLPNPVAIGGSDYGGTPALRTWKVDSSGNGMVTFSNTSLAVTGTFWQATQPVSGTFWQATQPISAVSLPLPTGAALDASLTTIDTDLKANVTLHAGTNVIGKFGIDQTTPGTTNGVQVNAALPAGTNVIGHVIVDTAPTTAVTGPLTDTQLRATAVPVTATLQTQTDTTMVGGVNVKEINGVAPLMGAGNTGTGSPRVTVASDQTAFGTIPTPSAASGTAVSDCAIVSAASTNATSCKGSAGNLYGYELFNTTTTVYYLRLYNTAGAPTCSSATGFIRSIPIPPAAAAGQVGGVVALYPFPTAYGTGIAFCITGGSSSTDNTNAAVGIFGVIKSE